jgi:hypothetical protein
MNVSVAPTTTTERPPHCYGDPTQWDKNAPECAGGPDANYVNPHTGKNVRYPCNFFSSCGTRAALAGRVIPPSQLVRPPVVPPAPSYQPYAAPPPQQPPPSNLGEYMRRVEAERMAAIGRPQYHPQQSPAWAPNYAVPSFLSAEEIRHPGESWWAPFLRMAARGVVKALGMVAAHWFDTRVMKVGPPPEKKE